jgi:hypothetical protein
VIPTMSHGPSDELIQTLRLILLLRSQSQTMLIVQASSQWARQSMKYKGSKQNKKMCLFCFDDDGLCKIKIMQSISYRGGIRARNITFHKT